MQIAVIEFARNVCGMDDADSGEFDFNSSHKVIDFLPDQNDGMDKGGTLRLGAYPCRLNPESKMAKLYNAEEISERHRHLYEFNNEYRDTLKDAGLVISGTSPDGVIVEAVEIGDHPYFEAVQFHPEFKSRPNKAHPLFMGLVKASLDAKSETDEK